MFWRSVVETFRGLTFRSWESTDAAGDVWRVFQGETGRRRWYVSRKPVGSSGFLVVANAGGKSSRSWATDTAAREAAEGMAARSAELRREVARSRAPDLVLHADGRVEGLREVLASIDAIEPVSVRGGRR